MIRTLELFLDPSCRMTTVSTDTLPEEDVRPLSDEAEDRCNFYINYLKVISTDFANDVIVLML